MYPVVLDLSGKRCLVIGGGRIAVRKAIGLLRTGARVVVVARECCRRMRTIAPRVTIFERPFGESDISRDYVLVIGATDDQDVNRRVSRPRKSTFSAISSTSPRSVRSWSRRLSGAGKSPLPFRPAPRRPALRVT